MPATVFPTHDGTFIASCRKTGWSASGRTHEHALQNFHSLVNSSHTDEESRSVEEHTLRLLHRDRSVRR